VDTRRGRGGGSFVRSREDALAQLGATRLAELGTTDLRELGDVHAAVAGAAARLAASRASAADIARLRDVLARLAGTDSVAAQRRADGRFYIEVAACAQSVRLTMTQMDILVEFGQLPWPPEHAPELLDAVVASHGAVVDALEARDAARARDLTDQHVDARTRWLIDLRLQRLAAAPPAATAADRQEVES
jgi:DNA-binding FadR family transcriptional regulator